MSMNPDLNAETARWSLVPADKLATLRRLTDAVWDPETEYPRLLLDGPKLSFPKREWGGYFVEFEGLRLGWVFKRTEYESGGLYDETETGWDAWTYDPGDGKNARRVANMTTTRRDAAESLAATVTKWDRFEFLWHLEEEEADRRRWADLEARLAEIRTGLDEDAAS